MYLVSLCFLYSTLFTLFCRICLFSHPITTNNFFKFVYSEIPRESAWRVLFRPPCCCLLLWQLKVIRTGLTSILDFWYPGPSYFMQEVIVLYFFVCIECPVHKQCIWRVHSFADTVPPFSTILQFSLELSNDWSTGLPCLCPSWIYCSRQQRNASLFPCLFSCLSSLCLHLLNHGLYLSFAQVFSVHTCTITSPFLRNTNCPFSSACLPLPGHLECPWWPS